MTHGTIVFDHGELGVEKWNVLGVGGKNGPDLVLRTECFASGYKADTGEVRVFDTLELDNKSVVTVYDHKGDETTAEKLAARLAADEELDE